MKTATDRARIAEEHGLSEPYLYQCMTGRKSMRPEDAVRLEQDSKGEVRRWEVRIHDWHRIWPEVIGIEGAPTPPADEAAKAAA